MSALCASQVFIKLLYKFVIYNDMGEKPNAMIMRARNAFIIYDNLFRKERGIFSK